VNAADLVLFARRDWQALADAKAAHWSDLKRALGAGESVRIGDELRRHVLAQHPGWPSDEERALDLETHVRVADALHLVAKRRRS
jgi:hypothetical protein